MQGKLLNSRNRVSLALLLIPGLLIVLLANAPAAPKQGPARDTTAVPHSTFAEPGSPEPATAVKSRIAAAYATLPLRFEANQGQADSRVRFLARGSGYNLFLTSTEMMLVLRAPAATAPSAEPIAARPTASVVRVRLLGATLRPEVTELEELPGRSNYFIGSNPAQWRAGIPNYRKVRYTGVYRGIDLVYYGTQGRLEYDFVVAPGAVASAIRFAVDGADKRSVNARGELVLKTGQGEVRLHKPVAYQMVAGVRRQISAHYVANREAEFGFEVGHYDAREPLFIDPVLVYSTYFGGTTGESGFGIGVDAYGNAYVVGNTSSLDLPLVNAVRPVYGGNIDAFVMKLNAAGNAVVYSTYLGGSASETGRAIAVDSAGNAYVTGMTRSSDFPTTAGALQARYGPAFIAKLPAAGNALVYSTYLPVDESNAIAVDDSGNAYVTGTVSSADFRSSPGAFQSSRAGASDAFVVKLNAAGSALAYATYIGGSAREQGLGIAVDSSQNAYVTGATTSFDFPVANALRPAPGGKAVYKTSNAGNSWSAASKGLVPTAVRTLVVSRRSPSTLYAGTDQGVFASTDSGNIWNSTDLMGRSVTVLALDPTNASTVYAGTDAGIFKTSDGGSTWTVTRLDPGRKVASLAIDPRAPSTVYAGTDAGVFKSTDAGWTWNFTNFRVYVNVLAVDPQIRNTIYAGINANGVYKSTDGGVNWFLMQTGIEGRSVYALAFDPWPANSIWAGTDRGVFVSNDRGDGWDPSSGGLARPVYAVATDPASSAIVYAGTDAGGVYKIDNTSGVWRPINVGIYSSGITALAVASSSIIYAGTAVGRDAFVVKLDASGSTAQYSTYLGGGGEDIGYAIAIDSSGNAYVTGSTSSSDFPTTTGAFQTQCGRSGGTAVCSSDAFVAKLNAAGSALVYSTYLGGTGSDIGYGIAVDSFGNACVAGSTDSADLPVAKAIQSTLGGNTDGFLAKLSAAGSALVYSTYLGGNGADEARGITLDASGSVYLTGFTESTNFPTANALMAANPGTARVAFIAKVASNPAPTISSLSPSGAGVGGAAFTLAVNGSGFLASSVIRWNGTDRTTFFVSGRQLQTAMAATDIATVGTAQVAVFNAPPDGGLSNALTFKISSGLPLPVIDPNGTVNGASFKPPLAAGLIASLFGSNLAAAPERAASLPLPTTLSGVTVRVNGIDAPLFYVSPQQINFLIPWEVLSQSKATITVTLLDNTSVPQTVALASTAPAIFTIDSAGYGAILIAPGGEFAAPVGKIPGAAARPAKRGEFISIFCAGLGDISNRPESGAAASSNPLSMTKTMPSVTIGGVPAAVAFSGLSPGFAGLYQVNVQVPGSVAPGSTVAVVLSLGATKSNSAFIAVQ